MKPFMLQRRGSWVRMGVLGFASLHCGTPNEADPVAQVAGATSDAPGVPADPLVTNPAVLAPFGAPGVDTSLPEVGGQTGDDSGSVGLACDIVTETTVALDDSARFGFSANDRLALVLGTHDIPLRWLTSEYDSSGSLDYTTRATSSIRVEVELVSEQARLLERYDSVYEQDCGPRLSVDARLTLSSADGALADTVDASLELGSDYDIVGLSALLPAAALGGDYAFEPAELDGRAPSALDVYVAFSRYGQRGEITQLYGEGNAAGRVSAQWPDWQPCSSWGRIPAHYPEQRPSAADVLADVQRRAPVTILGSDRERTPAQLDIEAVPNSGCHLPGTSGSATPSAERLTVQTQVTLTSEALPHPVHVPLDLVSSFTSDVGHGFFSALGSPCGTIGHYSPQDFVTHCGDWGIDLSLVESPFLEVESSITPASGYVEFRIRGMRYPGCTPGPEGFVCPADSPSSDNEVVDLGSVRVLLGAP